MYRFFFPIISCLLIVSACVTNKRAKQTNIKSTQASLFVSVFLSFSGNDTETNSRKSQIKKRALCPVTNRPFY